MTRKNTILTFTLGFLLILGFGINVLAQKDMAFGGSSDVSFAEKAWTAMQGYTDWPMRSGVYPGSSPHGKFLRLYYNMIEVEGKHYHVIIKDNYGGEDATQKKISRSPDKYLAAVTIMLHREKGYDPEHMNWFYVKYAPDGGIMENPKGIALAGRVAKGTNQGCIACHANAAGGDYLFTNDK